MLNWMRIAQSRVTDFEIGSVARTVLEAPAAEIDELYQQMFIGIREAIPVSIYRGFQFGTLEATPAVGLIRVTITPITGDTLIPAGTAFTRSAGGQVQYLSTADATIVGLDSYVDVSVSASAAGTAGNAPPGETFTMQPLPLSFVSAISPGGLGGGENGETEDQRRARFAQFIAALERSTHKAIYYAASLANIRDAGGLVIERVTSAMIVEPYLVDPLLYTPALVWLYIENRVGAPSSDLITRCQEIVDGYERDGVSYPGWKAAGVQVEVRAATRTTVAVTGVLTALAGYDAATLRSTALDAIFTYLSTLPIAAPAYRAQIVARVMAIEGVKNFTMSAPSSDITPGATEKLAPGAITIT